MGNKETKEEMKETILQNMPPRTPTSYKTIVALCGSIGPTEGYREYMVRATLVELVQENKLRHVGTAMFQLREDPEAEDASDAAILAALPLEDRAELEPIVRGEQVGGFVPDFDALDAGKDLEPDDSETEKNDAPPDAPPRVKAPKTQRPRGAFRAWALAYMQPNVLFRTKDLLARAIEDGMTDTTGAGQLMLNGMVRRGEIRRVRRGYFTLPNASMEPAAEAAASMPDAVPATEPEPPVAEVATEEAVPEPDPDLPPSEPEEEPRKGRVRVPRGEPPARKPRAARRRVKKKEKKKRAPSRPRAAPPTPPAPALSFDEIHGALKARHKAAVTRVADLRKERERLLHEVDRMDVELANASAEEAEARGLLRVVERLQC